MSRKKHQKKAKGPETNPEEKPRAKSRSELVLAIVATDSTFKPLFASATQYVRGPKSEIGWQGKCIHCNSKLYVGLQGETDATVEHIQPLCNGGHPEDPYNLALACSGCNNEKGIRHDRFADRDPRAQEVIAALQVRRADRWREPEVQPAPSGW